MQRKKDYKKIRKFLIRQTYSNDMNNQASNKLQNMSFNDFLVEVGMLEDEKSLDQLSVIEIEKARKRYLNALSVSII